ncbi:MAG: S9 family peptidase [Bacteroidales bacterium]|nr:S9 family peptidase [Bacteroidales bacterium]MBN2756308.1 S9 family peptidase [Bacteroidales bacterium]
MRKLISIIFVFLITANTFSQENLNKKPLDFNAYDLWSTLEHQAISDDGQWVCYEAVPYNDDIELNIINPITNKKYKVYRASSASFSPSSKFIAFKIKTEFKKVRELKLKKTKKDKFPKDTLGIIILGSNSFLKFDNLVSFEMPKEESSWIAYLYEKSKSENDSDNNQKEKKKKIKDLPEIYDLKIINPINNKEHQFENVSEINFSKNGKLLGFIQYNNDSLLESTIKIFDTETEKTIEIYKDKGLAKTITLDNSGKNAAFIFSADTVEFKNYSLNLWQTGKTASNEIVISRNSLEMPKDWGVSEFGKIWFSENDSKLYFGTALKIKPEEKDTLLDEEKVTLDIWTWSDPVLQSEQLSNLKKDQKKNYLTVYHINSNKVARIENELIDDVKTILKGNADIAFGIAEKPFLIESSWVFPPYKDIYTVDIITGDKKIILKKAQGEIDISPFGNFIFWFDGSDKNWYTYNIKTQEKKSLTKDINVDFSDDSHDLPYLAPSYSFAGWTKDDKYFLIYDKFDIWKLDPNGIENPICLTNSFGKKNNIKLRYIDLDKETEEIDFKNNILISGFNYLNKQSGYFQQAYYKSNPIKLEMDNYRFYNEIKARKSNAIIWRKSSVKEFSNLWYSDVNMKMPKKISELNSQQKKYNWASSELVSWKTFDGKDAEGILYKPENFNPNKKYPMLVYFYEQNSENLHAHYFIKPSRSIINPIFYASNEYLVFIPDIKYKIGHPGESAYNYVVSGTKAMISNGFVDSEKIGLQGTSWGGYQVAYIITQTNLYKAASAGAPVSNMTSAYGGIRWDSGMSRMYQYETTQSRIGVNLWENRELYIENSPIFFVDKIETPLLIRHDDNDGAVPWYQGIELFVAMRRLYKPVWLINYNGQAHNLKDKSPEAKDLSIRMMQFFDFYLKGKSAPNWMKYGIPALKKGKTLGYEIEE